MNEQLDEELRALRNEELPPPRYDHLETQVLQTISEARRRTPAVYAVRAASITVALGLGVVGGGAAAVAITGEANEVSVFSVQTELAPSTLLDSH